MEIKVQINATDLLGHINHANYFTYINEQKPEVIPNLYKEKLNERMMS